MNYSKEEIIKGIDKYCKSYNDFDFGNPDFLKRCLTCKLYSLCIAHNKRSDMEDYEFQYAEYILTKYGFLQQKPKLVEVPKEYLDYLATYCVGIPDSKCKKNECAFFELCDKYSNEKIAMMEEDDVKKFEDLIKNDKSQMEDDKAVQHLIDLFGTDTVRKTFICLAYIFRAKEKDYLANVYEDQYYKLDSDRKETNNE